jgi:hypothetical protein
VLFGSDYWDDLLKWVRKSMLKKYKFISPGDEHLCTVTDDVDEAVDIIKHGLADQERRAAMHAVQVSQRTTAEGTIMGMPLAIMHTGRRKTDRSKQSGKPTPGN